MKKELLLLIFIIATSTSYAQQISRSILTTAGDVSKNKDGVTVSWTIGDVFSQTVQEDNHLTEGFQQGTLTEKLPNTERVIQSSESKPQQSISQKNKISSEITLTAFPNPTTKELFIRTENFKVNEIIVNILDVSGKRISQQYININNGQDIRIQQIEKLDAGIYFIQIKNNQRTITTKQFTKI